MIDSAIISVKTHDAAPRRKDQAAHADAPGFSYALAAASLERKAAQSLEAHGARPSSDAAPAERAAAAGEGESRNQKIADAEKPAQAANAPRETANPRQTAIAQAAVKQPLANNVASAAASPSAEPLNATPAVQAKTGDASVVREASAAKAKLATQKALRLPSAPPALKAEFAEVLARRLDKTSIFEIRLDPPDLGRIDGRLSINDDGKAVLSLAFDNQSAFDLFSRDEQALRQALQQSGLQFGAGDFIFAFKERVAADSPSFDLGSSKSYAAGESYDPSFYASWSAGALDVRI